VASPNQYITSKSPSFLYRYIPIFFFCFYIILRTFMWGLRAPSLGASSHTRFAIFPDGSSSMCPCKLSNARPQWTAVRKVTWHRPVGPAAVPKATSVTAAGLISAASKIKPMMLSDVVPGGRRCTKRDKFGSGPWSRFFLWRSVPLLPFWWLPFRRCLANFSTRGSGPSRVSASSAQR